MQCNGRNWINQLAFCAQYPAAICVWCNRSVHIDGGDWVAIVFSKSFTLCYISQSLWLYASRTSFLFVDFGLIFFYISVFHSVIFVTLQVYYRLTLLEMSKKSDNAAIHTCFGFYTSRDSTLTAMPLASNDRKQAVFFTFINNLIRNSCFLRVPM